MALARCHPVLLFVAMLHVAAAHVKPPTNVTLRCRNLHNVLEWSYDQIPPGLRFRVDIGSVSSSSNVVWVDAPTLQADVSFLSDISDAYFLSVTAVIGQNESAAEPPNGIIFSYFKDSPADQKCFVDFPSVHITAKEDDIVVFHFKHPSLLYQQKLPGSPHPKTRKKTSHDAHDIKLLPVFMYDVEVINQKVQQHTFICVEHVCKEELPVDPAQQKHCLRMTGELQKMSVIATQEYCNLPTEKTPHESNNYIYIITSVLALALISVAFILFMVYRKMTIPSTAFPSSMSFRSGLKRFTLGLVQESVAVAEVDHTSPSPLLPVEKMESTTNVPSNTEPELRLPNRGLSTEDREVENNEGLGYMPGSNLEEDETPDFSKIPSGYEKRELLVNLSPDEEAEGYRHCGTDDL